MTQVPSRRTVLLATGAAALSTGCGGGGDNDGDDADTGSTASPGQELTRTSDVPVGGGTIFKDEQVVVTQPAEGEFKAFSSVCTHQRCTVADVSDGTINCACHGSRFSIEDGSVQNPPATRPLPEKQITVDGNSIRLA
ncbi:Rieske (2Fe-2S) protein [Streptomyces broussonetiae]|uniref:Cytochrome bc1 complex Rieske iron-sulfur subunit n=1 Tax=Streptomyces broussonetiae TaxID=2686304 RepID=A0ABV5E6U9_9ACTN